MTQTTIQFPVQYAELSQEETAMILGGAVQSTTETSSFGNFMDTVAKLSKVFNYLARIFSATSSMLNSANTIYTSTKSLNKYIKDNF